MPESLASTWSVHDFGRIRKSVITLVELNPPALDSVQERPPVDLALAFDRSSSMVGERVSLAVDAVRNLCTRLTERDRLGVVAFDQEVVSVKPPGPVHPHTAEEVSRELTRLGLGWGTDIEKGWKESYRLLARGGIPGAPKILLLLTDGYPSLGERDPNVLAAMTGDGETKGVVTNTVGIGRDFSEELLALMALTGGGRFRYVRNESDALAVADEEGVGEGGLVATNAAVSFEFTERVKRYDLLHELRSDLTEAGLSVHFGRLFAGSPRKVLLALGCSEEASALGLARVTYTRSNSLSGLESVKLRLATPGEEESASRHVGSAYVPWLVAVALKKIWKHALKSDFDFILTRIDQHRDNLRRIPEPFMQSAEARDSRDWFFSLCDQIEKEGKFSQEISKRMSEVRSSVISSRRPPGGWGRK